MTRNLLALASILILAPHALAFDCRPTLSTSGRDAKEIHFDLSGLAGEQTAIKTTETPPTTNEARVKFTLCGDDTLAQDTELAEEDQCPAGTKLCLTLLNHKPSSEEGARVTAVIPIWPNDLSSGNVKLTPRENTEGLDVSVTGNEYAGVGQSLLLELLCSPSVKDTAPTFESYSEGVLKLSWSTPEACPRALDGSQDLPEPTETQTGGSGIGKFFKTMFWLLFFGLLIYFTAGIYHNYKTYGASGMDLLPHKDFWMDLPSMISDLISHILAQIRGGSGGSTRRSGYTSLG